MYDLGLKNDQKEILLNGCNIHLEKFDFDQFPCYFKYLKHYRWKPIILAVSLSFLSTF